MSPAPEDLQLQVNKPGDETKIREQEWVSFQSLRAEWKVALEIWPTQVHGLPETAPAQTFGDRNAVKCNA